MKTIKTIGLALVAVFAMGAMVAESTSAAPLEFTTEKVLGSAFLEHALTEPPVDHLYVKSAHVRVECWSESDHGLTLKVGGVHKTVFTSGMCMAEQTERKERCSVKSPGAEKGEIITKELEGKLGYINEAAKEVGLLFKPSASMEFAVLEVESGSCFGLFNTVSLEGSVIGQIKPVNVETTEFEIVFKTVAEEQAITKFEGVSGEDVLNAFGFHAGLEATQKIIFREKEKLEA